MQQRHLPRGNQTSTTCTINDVTAADTAISVTFAINTYVSVNDGRLTSQRQHFG